MLPVARPQHASDGYQSREEQHRGLAEDDPIFAGLERVGRAYPDLYHSPRQHQQLPTTPHGMDLESIKNQKILEFREAIQQDLERKRQQAQRELEEAERAQWQQYLEFEQALKGFTQLYMSQSPMNYPIARPDTPMSRSHSYYDTCYASGHHSYSTQIPYNANIHAQNPISPSLGRVQPLSAYYNQQTPMTSHTRTMGSSRSSAMLSSSLPVSLETPGAQSPDIFTFDNTGMDRMTVARSRIGSTPVSSYPSNKSPAYNTPRGGIDTSSWGATYCTPNKISSSIKPAVKDPLFSQADKLEQEYARLTGKETPRDSALRNVKKMQEERRKKLEALTTRVVENRKRFAREVKTADRPHEIAFVDSREDHRAKKDTNLNFVRNKNEGIDGSRDKTKFSSGETVKESMLSDQSNKYSEESQSNEREISSRGDEDTADFFSTAVPSRELNALRRKNRKTKGSAVNYVGKLREKRAQAKGTGTASATKPTTLGSGSGYDIEPTYSRQDVLTALETGAKKISLPTRDPKLARKNRKLSTQRLAEKSGSRAMSPSKIATKKLTCASKQENKRIQADSTTSQCQAQQVQEKKNTMDQDAVGLIKKYIDPLGTTSRAEILPEEKEKREAVTDDKKVGTAASVVSDLSESAYTRKGQAKNRGYEESASSEIHFGFSDEEQEESHSDTTSKFERDAKYLLSSDNEDESDVDGARLQASRDPLPSTKKEGESKIKVRDLTADSIAEGFEVEDGFDIKSLVSSTSKQSQTPCTVQESSEETEQRYTTLKYLEQNLDTRDFQRIIPQLLKFTDKYGWDLNTVLKQFIHVASGSSSKAQSSNYRSSSSATPSAYTSVSASASTVQAKTRVASEKQDRPYCSDSREPVQTSRATSPLPKSLPSHRARATSPTPSSTRDVPPLSPSSPKSQATGETGWRLRVRSGSSHRALSSKEDHSSIDMSDVRTSLKSLSQRVKRGSRRTTAP